MKKYWEALAIGGVTAIGGYIATTILGWLGPQGLLLACILGVAAGALYLGVRYVIVFVRMAHSSHNTLLTVTKSLDNHAKEIDRLIKLSGQLTTESTTLHRTVAQLQKESPARTETIEKIAAAMVANAMVEHTKQKPVKSLADYNHLINSPPHPTEVLEASALIDAARLGLGLGPDAKKKSS